MTVLNFENKDEISKLLVGRTAVKVDEMTLELDNGTVLILVGQDGGCCVSYDLTELNGVDNVITNVEFVDSPAGDDLYGEGHYKIFVYAGNDKINLATFEGSDGNGYYGTGYWITVQRDKQQD